MDITSEIFQVGGSGLSSPEDAAVYLIHFDGHAALVDAGCGPSAPAITGNIEKHGIPLEAIDLLLVTHCHYDHTGGILPLRKGLTCRVVAHAEDAYYMETGDSRVTAASWYGVYMDPVAVDWKISGEREEIRLGDRLIEAFHTPGHSPGSMVFLTDSDGYRVLFGQDVHGPLHPSLLSDRDAYRQSLEFLISLEADILCEGHFGIYRGKKEVAEFIRSFL